MKSRFVSTWRHGWFVSDQQAKYDACRSHATNLLGVLQSHWVMAELVKEKFTGYPKFHPKMVMFILETMITRVELEDISAAYANVSALPLIVRNLVLPVDAFNFRVFALEATTVLEVGGGTDMSINARRNQNRQSGENGSGGNGGGGIVDIT